MSVRLISYQSNLQEQWDEAVEQMRNATFLHLRRFMDYHAERFVDASLLFAVNNNIRGLLPANYSEQSRRICAHQGLTYGGLLVHDKANYTHVDAMLHMARAYYKQVYPKAKELVLKPTPYIYHRACSEELLYWLHQHGATLSARAISSCIMLDSSTAVFSTLRRRRLKKAQQQSWQTRWLDVTNASDLLRLNHFWNLLTHTLLTQHGVAPIHTLLEIQALWSNFPKHIHIILVEECHTQQVIAGTVLFDALPTRHVQYIANSAYGRESGALELLFDTIIKVSLGHFTYFDFGISTEQGGTLLNEGLLFQKEGFGARGVCYDTYTLPL
ncbi:MAG: GNAT family N-acetyltransferase [Bacteroidales bacterium]|nr:GNAT family N-acetyltransferase [Bacteroidales bacterium]